MEHHLKQDNYRNKKKRKNHLIESISFNCLSKTTVN